MSKKTVALEEPNASGTKEAYNSPLEKAWYPEILEDGELIGTPADYYAMIYRSSADGDDFLARTKADITPEEIKDGYGPGRYTIKLKSKVKNQFAGQNTIRIAGANGTQLSGQELTHSQQAGPISTPITDFAGFTRAIESLVKSVQEQQQPQRRSEIEDLLIKIALEKLTTTPQVKSLSDQIKEFAQIKSLLDGGKTHDDDHDFFENIDKKLNLAEKLNNLTKKLGSTEDESGFSGKEMIELGKALLPGLIGILQQQPQHVPQALEHGQALQYIPITHGQNMAAQKQEPTPTTPEMEFENWLKRFPENIRKAVDLTAKAMVGEANHDLYLQALKKEVNNDDGKVKPQYSDFMLFLKGNATVVKQLLKNQGFPVTQHEAWTDTAIQKINETFANA